MINCRLTDWESLHCSSVWAELWLPCFLAASRVAKEMNKLESCPQPALRWQCCPTNNLQTTTCEATTTYETFTLNLLHSETIKEKSKYYKIKHQQIILLLCLPLCCVMWTERKRRGDEEFPCSSHCLSGQRSAIMSQPLALCNDEVGCAPLSSTLV